MAILAKVAHGVRSGAVRRVLGALSVLATLSACAGSLATLQMHAEEGDPHAQVALGMAYLEGSGVPRDEAKAVALVREAANAGHAVGQIALGAMYSDGEGVPQDQRTAVDWYRKAAEQGSPLGQLLLGSKYYEGVGVTKDPARALQLFRRAEDGFRSELARDNSDEPRWGLAGAQQGLAQVEYSYGLMHYMGEGATKDDALAFEWYAKAANRGHMLAQFNLASMYLNGEGTPKDDVRAYAWFRLSALQGFEPAERNRSLLRKSLNTKDYFGAESLSRQIQFRLPRLGLPR